MNFDVTYYSRIYRDFCALGDEDYPSVVHYYENHENGIQQLEFSEYFEILAAYTFSLYKINEHSKHILMSEVLVGEAINHNITHHKKEDIFYNTLLRKAVSCNHLLRHADAEHILRELIKIKPNNTFARRELRKCLTQQTPDYLKKIRAAAVLLLFTSAAIIVVELLFIRHLYPILTPWFEYSRITLFCLAVLILIFSEVWFKRKVKQKTKALIASAAQKKAGYSEE